MPDTAIRTEGLTRDFDHLRALDGLTLDVPPGIIFGFLGPNGAGKTTTIRLLLGLLEPTKGQAEVLGYDTRTQSDKIRARTGALLEYPGLYERLSAEDNMEFYARVWGIPEPERKTRIKELLSHVDLWDRRRNQVRDWSRGMRQKLAVARMLIHRPSLIFLDEPTAGLDPVAAAALRDDLAKLTESEGVTVFLTTHNLVEAEKLCRQVGVIRNGKLLAVGSPDDLRAKGGPPKVEIVGSGFSEALLSDLRQRPEVAGVRLENGHLLVEMKSEGPAAPLVSLVVGSGAAVEEVHKGKASLEEVFLTLMEEEK